MAIGEAFINIVDQRVTGTIGAIPIVTVSVTILLDGDTLVIREISGGKQGSIFADGPQGGRFQSSMENLAVIARLTTPSASDYDFINGPSHVDSPPQSGFLKVDLVLADWGVRLGSDLPFMSAITRMGTLQIEETT